MNEFPPNIDPKIATISAFLIGIALMDNFSAAEQNAIGNWFITIGQTLENTSAWQAMIESRIAGNTININSKKYKCTGNPYMDNDAWMKSPSDMEFERLKKIVCIMQEELEKLQKKRTN
jgi:hypothetical protein